MDTQANAQRNIERNTVQNAQNEQSALTLLKGLVNADVLDNTNVNLQANCEVNVFSDNC